MQLKRRTQDSLTQNNKTKKIKLYTERERGQTKTQTREQNMKH